MATFFTFEIVSKFSSYKPIFLPLTFSRPCIKKSGTQLLQYKVHNSQASIFTNKITLAEFSSTAPSRSCFFGLMSNSTTSEPNLSTSGLPVQATAVLQGLNSHAALACLVPARHYGRKMPQKPPKITYFQYSGDLRTLPTLDKNLILSKYQDLEDEIEKNEVLKKLCSLDFATAKEYADHRSQLIKDRIVELFGPDSEIEQRIALLTLSIRQMIPYCIKYRTDKVNKVRLLKRIFLRRKLLTDLRNIDHERFEWLLRELKIRYVIPKDPVPFKGWKHDLRVAKQEEARSKQRKKLEELKEKFESEKKVFFEHKAKLLAQIEEDLNRLGVDRSFLDQLLLQKQTSANQGLQNKHDLTSQGKQS